MPFQYIQRLPHASLRVRAAVLTVAMVCALAVSGWVYWDQEAKFALPTPKPPHLKETPLGMVLPFASLDPRLEPLPGDKRLVMLHFFNGGCPCSRFNTTHVLSLERLYGSKVRIVPIIESDEADPDEREAEVLDAQRRFGVPVLDDPDGRIAAACGVYSTPQAVILTSDERLLYRGNYNVSRYCTNPASEFARVVIASALEGKPVPPLPPEATVAYGCALPANEVAATRTLSR